MTDTTLISRKTILNKDAISTLTTAVTDISSCRSIEEVADSSTNQLIKLINAETCIFISRNKDGDDLQVIKVCDTDSSFNTLSFVSDHFNSKCSLVRRILKEKSILQIHHTDPGLTEGDRKCLQTTNIKSMLLLPLMAEGKLNGLIAIGQISISRLFTEQDILLAHLIASQSSAALESARLYQSVIQYSNELEAFHNVGLTITSSLNIKSVISSILQSSMRLLSDAQNSHMFLYDSEKLSFISALWYDGERQEPKAHPRPDGLTYTVARSGELIFVPDMTNHPLFQNVPPDWTGSIIGLPLKYGDRVVGVMTIAFTNPRELTDAEQRVLKMMGAQAAIAIENARLYERIVQNAQQMEAITQASISLTSSLNLEDVLSAIINSSFTFIEGLKDSHIFLYDGNQLTFGAGMMDDGTRLEKPYAEPRQNGLTYSVAKSGNPILIPEMHDHIMFKDAPPDWKGALIGLPLKIRNRVVGAMTMACLESKEFSEEDLRILRMLGDQAAIAIENANLHKMIEQQAHTDFLTQLPNRRSFEERLEDEIRRSHRYQHHFVMAMMDMNGFKRINDNFGHPVGDKALRQIADCLHSSIRETDFLARIGGDEFGLLMPETDRKTGNLVVKRLQENLKKLKLILPDNRTDILTISAGLSAYPADEDTHSGLFHIADQNLYKSKRMLKDLRDNHTV